jgi:predicted RND superfamily exporter protein
MKKTAKEIVIESLLTEEYLDISSLNKKIKENSEKVFGYHSIYKAVKQLVDEKVIVKCQEGYHLSEEWVMENLSFLEKLKEHINETKGFSHEACDFSVFEFENIKKLNDFLRKVENEHMSVFSKDKKSTIIRVVHHCYNYLLQPAQELAYIRKLKENNIDLKILCYGNTPLDKWTKDALEKFGAVMKIGANAGGITSKKVYEDFVVDIFFDKKFLDILNEVYSKAESVNDLDPSNLFEKLINTNYKINVILYKNKDIVKNIRDRTLGFFE